MGSHQHHTLEWILEPVDERPIVPVTLQSAEGDDLFIEVFELDLEDARPLVPA